MLLRVFNDYIFYIFVLNNSCIEIVQTFIIPINYKKQIRSIHPCNHFTFISKKKSFRAESQKN